MNISNLTFMAVIAVIIFTCTQTGELQPSRVMQVQPSEVSAFHQPVSVQVGWFPYREHRLVRTGRDEWQVVKNEDGSAKTGAVPQILIRYPRSSDSLWVDMNIDNALLGKLIKHTIMTEAPITRPFSEYMEVASCSKCHPSDIEIDFE
jgi:hypothetical protein